MDGLKDATGFEWRKIVPKLAHLLDDVGNLFGLRLLADEKVDRDNLVKMLELEGKIIESDVEDRKSARAREIALNDHVPFILAMVFIVIYFVIQIYVVWYPSPHVDVVSARVQDVLIMIYSYYFGSMHKNKKISHE